MALFQTSVGPPIGGLTRRLYHLAVLRFALQFVQGGGMPNYAPLKIAPYWQMTNENLIELIDLVPEDKLDWTPAPGEWSTRLIATHMILARNHAPIVQGRDGAPMSEVIMDCRTKE